MCLLTCCQAHHTVLVPKTATVRKAMEMICEAKAYRVCLTEEEVSSKIVAVVSQSDMVRFIYKHREEVLLEDKDKAIVELKDFGTSGVICVKLKETVKNALLL